jgi:hypothetical protein
VDVYNNNGEIVIIEGLEAKIELIIARQRDKNPLEVDFQSEWQNFFFFRLPFKGHILLCRGGCSQGDTAAKARPVEEAESQPNHLP